MGPIDLKIFRLYSFIRCVILFELIVFSNLTFGQQGAGILRGNVKDGSTGKNLAGVLIKPDTSVSFVSYADGSYLMYLKPGTYVVSYEYGGFQNKIISKVVIISGMITELNVILSTPKKPVRNVPKDDSSKSTAAKTYVLFEEEKHRATYNALQNRDSKSDIIPENEICSSYEKSGDQTLQRLNGVLTQSVPSVPALQSLSILGLNNRYNQVLINGAVLNSSEALGNFYPLSLIPSDAIQMVSLQKTGNTSLPANFSGGSVEIKLKDFPAYNFLSVKLGGGFSGATAGKNFYTDVNSGGEFLSFPGAIRNLPASFPTAKSQESFNSKTAEEKIILSMKLKNNLAPVNHGISKPDDNFQLGFGKVISLKGSTKIGIVAYLDQATSEKIDNSLVQVLPDVVSNPYPFIDNSKVFINTQSHDLNYRYTSQFSGIFNASVLYGKSKISFTNFLGSIFDNVYTDRTQIYKPDEDSAARYSIYHKSSHRFFINTQLAGEHALGENGKFRLNWHAAYNYSGEDNPDERSFLLKQDSSDARKFAIAPVSAAPFAPAQFSDPGVYDPNLTNSSRLWRSLRENDFEGAVNISTTFHLFQQSQNIAGGVFVQSRYRVFHSDLLQTTGTGYYTLDNLLSPENYTTGNLAVRSYYSNFGGSYSYVYANNRGNYDASGNVGASYFRLENKFTDDLFLNWGFRVEASNQLVSNTQYDYVPGDSKPTISPLDKNIFVNKVDFLPAVEMKYTFLKAMQFHAAFFKTVNRPQLQELTSYRYYDPIAFLVKIGNPILQNSLISNSEAGVSWIPRAATSVSVSGFYKKMDQPIENILSPYTISSLISQPFNMPPATIFGLNVDFKLSLGDITDVPFISNFNLFGNGNILKSEVKAGYVRNLENTIPKHTLSGSPDFSFNAGLIFNKPGLPVITVGFEGSGDYISAVGYGKAISLNNGKNISSIPDYRIKGNEQIDLQVSQKIFRSKVLLVAGINNLLNTSYVIYQDLNGNKKFDAPLQLTSINNRSGFYQSGIDNTISYIKNQRTYFFTLSYSFNQL